MNKTLIYKFSFGAIPLVLLSACGGSASSSSSLGPTAEPFFLNVYARPTSDNVPTTKIKIRPYYKDNGAKASVSYSDYDDNVISIDSDGLITAKKRGITKVTATAGEYTKKFTVTSHTYFEGFQDENWDYRIDNYSSTFGSPKNYVCFLGDSFFDERGYWKTFSKDYEDKKAYIGGLGGAVTHDMRELLDQWTLGFSPSAIVLNVSCNNIDNIHEDGETAFYNLRFLLEDIHERKPSLKVYVESITPSFPCIDNWPKAQIANSLAKEYISSHSDYLTYLPLGEAFAEHMSAVKNEDGTTTPSYLGSDGMHPSETGYKVIKDMLTQYITIPDI